MTISKLLSLILNSIHSSKPEHIIIQTIMYPVTPIVHILYQLSGITI